jgi:inosose dehydratase
MTVILDGMREAVRVGKENGILVTVEDYDHRDSPTATSAEILYLLARVEGLLVTFDTGNFIFSDEDIGEAFFALSDKTVNLHLKDRGEDDIHTGVHLRGLAPVAVGDGYLALSPILSALRERGYSGYLTVEHFGVPSYREATERSVAFLSRFLA